MELNVIILIQIKARFMAIMLTTVMIINADDFVMRDYCGGKENEWYDLTARIVFRGIFFLLVGNSRPN